MVRSVITDRDGSAHVRYDRTYKGLRVVGGDLIVDRSPDGAAKNVHGLTRGTAAVSSTKPKIAEKKALAAAESVGTVTDAPDGELVVYAGGAKPVLAYDVVVSSVRADQVPSRVHTIVDASTGKVLTAWDDIHTGTGDGIYVKDATFGTTASGGSFQLKDAAGNYVTDVHNQGDPNTGDGPDGDLLLDADDIWGNGSYTDRASAAVDAQWGAETTFNFYKSVLGRNGVWDDGRGARSRVHFADGMKNAFWDGTQMSYGDGANNANPLTELDVAAHEMSHGVTENTANLDYGAPQLGIFKESGGLNEATSDIFGTAVEWYANAPGDTPDYLIGERLDYFGNGKPLRYMDQPSRDGRSRDCWTASMGTTIDPHMSSGPLNHWYYLASEGSGAKTINGVAYNSPTCDGRSFTGAGHSNIEKVWYRTLSTKLTSNSTYKDAREGAITSAIELYGADSPTCAAVEKAFNAISVPVGAAKCSGGTTPPSTGANLLQNPGFESGRTVWTGTSGPITDSGLRPAHSGSWIMYLGGNGVTASENEQQTVTIPATATKATLSFWLRIDTAETGTLAVDTAKIQVTSGSTTTTLATYSNRDANSAYALKSFDVSAYKGKTITVKFRMNENSSRQTSFVVDDTALTVS